MRTITDKPTLFVGAHPDDIAISSAISIRRDPKKSYVVTVTHGAPVFVDTYPVVALSGTVIENQAAFAEIRVAEDKTVFKSIGVPQDQYWNFSVPDQECHLNISEIITQLKKIVQEKIEKGV